MMQFTIREMTGGRMRHAIAAIALGLTLAFFGGFGTQQTLSPLGRTVFWLALVATGYLFALGARAIIGNRIASPLASAVVVTLLSALPQLFIVSWALVQVRPGRIIALGNLPILFATVATVQAIIVATCFAVSRSLARPILEPAELEVGSLPGRISPTLRRDLVALEAEDHYVRVHHGPGSTLLLHRFGDAMAELSAIDGLQVHRGWWVARAAVTGTFVRDGKRWLLLENTLQVPVSRTYSRAVADQRWPRVADPGPRD